MKNLGFGVNSNVQPPQKPITIVQRTDNHPEYGRLIIKNGLKLVLLGLVITGGILAQAPAPKPVEKPVPTICPEKEPDCKDKLLLENLSMKINKIVDDFNNQAQKQFLQSVQPQIQPMQDERAAIIKKLNFEHPGYEWHDSIGIGDPTGFREIPAPAPAIAKPADPKVMQPASK